jgi:hypothetical protein
MNRARQEIRANAWDTYIRAARNKTTSVNNRIWEIRVLLFKEGNEVVLPKRSS